MNCGRSFEVGDVAGAGDLDVAAVGDADRRGGGRSSAASRGRARRRRRGVGRGDLRQPVAHVVRRQTPDRTFERVRIDARHRGRGLADRGRAGSHDRSRTHRRRSMPASHRRGSARGGPRPRSRRRWSRRTRTPGWCRTARANEPAPDSPSARWRATIPPIESPTTCAAPAPNPLIHVAAARGERIERPLTWRSAGAVAGHVPRGCPVSRRRERRQLRLPRDAAPAETVEQDDELAVGRSGLAPRDRTLVAITRDRRPRVFGVRRRHRASVRRSPPARRR